MKTATMAALATAALMAVACGETRKRIPVEPVTPSVIYYDAALKTIVAKRPQLPKDYVTAAVAVSPSGVVLYQEAPVITVTGSRRKPTPAMLSAARRARDRAACRATPKAKTCI